MSRDVRLTRRHLLSAGLGALAASTAAAPLAKLGVTPAQSEGPFYPDQPPPESDTDLTRLSGHSQRATGRVIEISGQVQDLEGNPLADVLVEIWQANHWGRYRHEHDPNPAPLDPHFQGSGQTLTDAEGRYRFTTIYPGSYPASASWRRPPHIHFKVARRGFRELTTQLYFAGEALNARDRLLQSLPATERQRLLVKLTEGAGDRPSQGQFNLILQPV